MPLLNRYLRRVEKYQDTLNIVALDLNVTIMAKGLFDPYYKTKTVAS